MDSSASQQIDTKNSNKINLFFIKSKHAFSQFKNHEYFEMSCGKREQEISSSKQYVNFPTPYGINNAFSYICQEAKKNHPRNKTQPRAQKQNSFKKLSAEKLSFSKKLTLPQVTNKYFQSQSMKKDRFIQSRKISKQLIKKKDVKMQQQIRFAFIDKSLKYEKTLQKEMRVDIYRFILKTFRKCKFYYNDMTQEEFRFIKSAIINIVDTSPQDFELKDIINMASIPKLMQFLNFHSQSSIEFRQAIRYFFIANPQTYDYQFNRIKQELKLLTNFKFNKQISTEDLIIFDELSGQKISNFIQLLQNCDKNLIYGADQSTIKHFRQYKREKEAKQKLERQITKWKSISSSNEELSWRHSGVSSNKCRKIFATMQKRRERMAKKRLGVQPVQSLKFVELQKLKRGQDFFE